MAGRRGGLGLSALPVDLVRVEVRGSTASTSELLLVLAGVEIPMRRVSADDFRSVHEFQLSWPVPKLGLIAKPALTHSGLHVELTLQNGNPITKTLQAGELAESTPVVLVETRDSFHV